MSAQLLPTITAAIRPEKFADRLFFSQKIKIILLIVFVISGFSLRVSNLGAESLSEDELNKLQTVADYRANGLSGRNGEHPFLMKGLQTVSLMISDKLNNSLFSQNKISDEAALRFPTVVIGTLTIIALFLLVSELFGASLGLIAAALWAVDPSAVGFDRIAKEDSFLLFFFLLGNFFWIRGQTLAERGAENWTKYLWLAAGAFGAMIASKYLPHLIAVTAAYYQIFQNIPATKWRLGKTRWLQFLVVMGLCFIVFNPTILFPDTWREMLTFGRENRIGHDAYEFFGELYRNKVTLWLAGVPWTFYYVFILFKIPLATLLFFFVGLPVIFQRRFGDGRFFILFWAFYWFMPFTVLGGKFTRYFTVAEPVILIVAAFGIYAAVEWLAAKFFDKNSFAAAVLQATIPAAVVLYSIFAAVSFAPHYRLYTNPLGGGKSNAGFYFPHDEFYDLATGASVAEIIKLARPSATIANETPGLFEHYAKKAGRGDLKSVSLSDKAEISKLEVGDFILAARGRRYFSNDAYLKRLETVAPVAEVKTGGIPAAKIYQLDAAMLTQIQALAK